VYTITDSNPTIGTFTCPLVADLPVGMASAVDCGITKNYTLVQRDLDAGSVINTATATALGKVTGTMVTSPPSTATVITYTAARLGITKIAAPTFFTAAGDKITYTYALRNTGGLALTVTSPYTLTDDKTGTITCAAIASLAIGASAPCGASPYTVLPADNSSGFVTNTVSVTTGSTTPATCASGCSTTKTVPKFICSITTLTGSPSPIPPMTAGQTASNWTITNNTGTDVHIQSITLQWNAGGVINLTSVLLGGSTIWGPGTNNSGGVILPNVPPGGWRLPYNGASTPTILQLNFSTNTSGIKILVTFVESACPSLNSGP
jgi:hypothetical protein